MLAKITTQSPASDSTRGSSDSEPVVIFSPPPPPVLPAIRDYYSDILNHMRAQEKKETLVAPLARHTVGEELRARTLDWMIEAVTKSDCAVQTFFRAAYLMDRFFEHSKSVLRPSEMQTLAVTSMQLASKLEDVTFIDSRFAQDHVAHHQVSVKDIFACERKFLKSLQYRLSLPEEHEFVTIYLAAEEIRGVVTEYSLPNMAPDAQFVAMANVFNYKMICGKGEQSRSSTRAAGSLLFVLRNRMADTSAKAMKKLLRAVVWASRGREEEIAKMSGEIEEHVLQFRKLHPKLERIYKFNAVTIG